MFLTAPSAQSGTFLNGDSLGCGGDTSGVVGEPRPACVVGETEEVDGRAVRLQGEELAEGEEVGGRAVDACRQKAVSSRRCQSDLKCSPWVAESSVGGVGRVCVSVAQMPDAQCLMWMCTANVEEEA